MPNFSEKFLEKTIQAWQPYSETLLSLEDAREIAENMIGLYALLLELEQKYGKDETKS